MLQRPIKGSHVGSEIGRVGTRQETGRGELGDLPSLQLLKRNSRRHDGGIVAEGLLLVHSNGRKSSESSIDVCTGESERRISPRAQGGDGTEDD
jgi:hypothetical protein